MWPKDADGNEIIPENYNPYAFIDSAHIFFTIASLAFATTMMWSLLTG